MSSWQVCKLIEKAGAGVNTKDYGYTYLRITSSLHSQLTMGLCLIAVATALIKISLTEILMSGIAFNSFLNLRGRGET